MNLVKLLMLWWVKQDVKCGIAEDKERESVRDSKRMKVGDELLRMKNMA